MMSMIHQTRTYLIILANARGDKLAQGIEFTTILCSDGDVHLDVLLPPFSVAG